MLAPTSPLVMSAVTFVRFITKLEFPYMMSIAVKIVPARIEFTGWPCGMRTNLPGIWFSLASSMVIREAPITLALAENRMEKTAERAMTEAPIPPKFHLSLFSYASVASLSTAEIEMWMNSAKAVK